MKTDFYIDGVGSDRFSARLLSNFKVGATEITRSRLKSSRVQGWIPLSSNYGLRTLQIPVYIFGESAQDAAKRKSELDQAMLAEPVELLMPDGLYYTASLEEISEAEPMQIDRSELKCTYTLLGYAHDPLVTVKVSSGVAFTVSGTAPEMDCRLTCTVKTTASSFKMAGVTWSSVKSGDVLVLDGLNKQVTRNCANDFSSTDLISWPKLVPGSNKLTAPVQIKVEYYPIWL